MWLQRVRHNWVTIALVSLENSSQEFIVWGNGTHYGTWTCATCQLYRCKLANNRLKNWLSTCSVVSDSLQPHELWHTRLPCPSPSPEVRSNSCPLSRWCHWTISSTVTPFSTCPQSFPALWSFPVSQLFASNGQSIGASASVLPINCIRT